MGRGNDEASSTVSGVFELVRYIDGQAVPYVPFRAGCTSCCAPSVPAAPSASCCGH